MGRRTDIVRGKVVIDGVELEAKECRLCNVMQPLMNYTKRNDMVDGHINNCKSCMAKRQAEYAKKRPDIRREAERKWRENNIDKVKEMSRRSREKHADDYRDRLRKWRENNPERNRAINQRYRENNRDTVRESSKKWVDANKEKTIVYSANRRARVRSLRHDFDAGWGSLLLDIYGGCVVTGTRENIHWDHFIPIATGKGGTYAGNMIPLSAELNLRKGSKNPIDFLLDNGISYGELYNILYILAWLNDMSITEYVSFVYTCFEEKEVV